MKSHLLYRASAVLLLLFAAGHSLGFHQADPAWKVDALLGTMRSTRFAVQGFERTYWDFFLASGFTVGVLYVFSAILAWQLGGQPAETLKGMRLTRWAFALCFALVAAVSWAHLFVIPIVFSSVIAVLLTAAAWRSERSA